MFLPPKQNGKINYYRRASMLGVKDKNLQHGRWFAKDSKS